MILKKFKVSRVWIFSKFLRKTNYVSLGGLRNAQKKVKIFLGVRNAQRAQNKLR